MTSQSITYQEAAPRSSLVSRLLATRAGLDPLILRLMLAAVMLPHGMQKLFGSFGGYGFEGTMGFLTGKIGLPWILAFGVILLEFLGPLLLVVGLGTRLVAAGFIGLMVGAIVTVHAQFGFFMNWSGQQAGEGYEYHLLMIALAAALVLRGAGSLSVDRKLSRS